MRPPSIARSLGRVLGKDSDDGPPPVPIPIPVPAPIPNPNPQAGHARGGGSPGPEPPRLRPRRGDGQTVRSAAWYLPPPPPSPRLTGHAAAAAARGPPSPRVFTAPHHSFTVSRSSPLSAAIVCGDLVICKLPIERACFAACVCTSPKVKKLL